MNSNRRNVPNSACRTVKRITTAAICLLLTLASAPSFAADSGPTHTDVSIIHSMGSSYAALANKIDSALENKSVTVHRYKYRELNDLSARQKELTQHQLIISVGTKATEYLAEHTPDAKVLSVFVTASSFRSAISSLQNTNHQFFAIILDQPVERYFKLARSILPTANELGTLGATAGDVNYQHHKIQAQACDFSLNITPFGQRSNPIRLLNGLFESNEAVLVLPQINALDPNSAKWVLHLSTRHKVPIIAFSEKFVAAGAIASIYSSQEDISAETADLVSSWPFDSQSSDSKVRTATRFSVKTNPRVARFMGISLVSDAQLQTAIVAEKSPCLAKGVSK